MKAPVQIICTKDEFRKRPVSEATIDRGVEYLGRLMDELSVKGRILVMPAHVNGDESLVLAVERPVDLPDGETGHIISNLFVLVTASMDIRDEENEAVMSGIEAVEAKLAKIGGKIRERVNEFDSYIPIPGARDQ